jgi:hypothetical protein
MSFSHLWHNSPKIFYILDLNNHLRNQKIEALNKKGNIIHDTYLSKDNFLLQGRLKTNHPHKIDYVGLNWSFTLDIHYGSLV